MRADFDGLSQQGNKIFGKASINVHCMAACVFCLAAYMCAAWLRNLTHLMIFENNSLMSRPSSCELGNSFKQLALSPCALALFVHSWLWAQADLQRRTTCTGPMHLVANKHTHTASEQKARTHEHSARVPRSLYRPKQSDAKTQRSSSCLRTARVSLTPRRRHQFCWQAPIKAIEC